MTNPHQTDEVTPVVIPEIATAPHLRVDDPDAARLTATGGHRFEAQHLAFAEFQEGYVRNYIGLADTKATWAFAVAGGVLAFLLGQSSIQTLLLRPAFTLTFGLLCVSLGLLVLSAMFAFLVIAPRLGAPSREGVVFFGAVAARQSADRFVTDVAARSEGELIESRLRHCYDVSKVCAFKYANLKRAIWLGLPALACTLAMLLVA